MAARVAKKVLKTGSIVLGQCVPCIKENASKIKIKRLELDVNLLMYFKKDNFVYVTDPKKMCKPGDVVLIQELPEKMTKLITHKVVEIVFPYGDITDPITGKKVVVGSYRDDIAIQTETCGKLDSTFDYENAPPRGWQEGKKDFTDQETYIKYQEEPGKDQPYGY